MMEITIKIKLKHSAEVRQFGVMAQAASVLMHTLNRQDYDSILVQSKTKSDAKIYIESCNNDGK